MKADPNYIQLSVSGMEALATGKPSDLEVFLPSRTTGDPVLYRRPGAGLSRPDFERMRNRGAKWLFVRKEQLQALGGSLETQLAEVLRSPDFEPLDKAHIANSVGIEVVGEMINTPGAIPNVDRASQVVDTLVGSVLDDPITAAYLVQMAGHDRSTAGHMFAVSVLAPLLGAEIFGPDRKVLTDLAMAGMLHDLGKLVIHRNILQKPTALTREELQLIQQHPIESVRLIGDDPHVTPAARRMIIQHHEHVDGKGYPLGLSGQELDPGSKVLSIVDTFHALIGKRAYRDPITPEEANRLIKAGAHKQFDAAYLANWQHLFERTAGCVDAQHLGTGPETIENESSRHEHNAAARAPSSAGPRATRHPCTTQPAIRCIYAGRLRDVSSATNEFTARALDISKSGMCLLSEHPMYRGEIAYVYIAKGEARVWVRGTVAWCHPSDEAGYRIGMRFERRMSDNDLAESANVAPICQPDDPDRRRIIVEAQRTGIVGTRHTA